MNEEKWHLEKKVSIGQILVILTTITGILWWGAKIEKRLSVLEESKLMHDTIHSHEGNNISDFFVRIENQLEHMSDRIDDIYSR